MKKFALIYAMFAVTIGGLVAPPAIVVRAQDNARQPGQQSEISDIELKAFAKAYVEFHRIRSAYENSLDDVRDLKNRPKRNTRLSSR